MFRDIEDRKRVPIRQVLSFKVIATYKLTERPDEPDAIGAMTVDSAMVYDGDTIKRRSQRMTMTRWGSLEFMSGGPS
jgi:hypothetical protein